MRLKRSNTAHAPVAATVTTFSIYFTGLCIILSLSSAGSCGKLSWSSQGQSSGDKAPLCQDLIGAAEAAPLRSYLLEAVCPLFPGLNLGAADRDEARTARCRSYPMEVGQGWHLQGNERAKMGVQ